MIRVVDWGLSEKLPVLEFMIHSSELMPGGSPYFRNRPDIERLYSDLDLLLSHASTMGISGATLAEYRQTVARIS
jgi:hypothetical protein